MNNKKLLYRDTENQKLLGVAKGMADYLDLDPTLVRVLWAVVSCFAGFGIVLYLVLALVLDPKDVVMARAMQEEQKAKKNSDDPFAKYDDPRFEK